MSKKSFLQSIWRTIVGNGDAANQKHISAAQALILQKKYLEERAEAVNIDEYPPYVDIARQLFSEKDDIFRAAVFYLRRIAENESKYAEPIVTVMKQYAKTAKRTSEETSFLNEQIKAIEKNIHFKI